MTVPSDLYTTWLPIGLTAILALVGLLRGGWREAVVSGSIVLAAMINEQWAARWAADLHEFVTGPSVSEEQFALSFFVMVLVVLVIGYILGSAVVRGRPGASSRLLGGLLGALNGAALAGWLQLYAYTNLDSTRPDSIYIRSPFSTGFMVWAGWFPVALAVIGAVVAFLSPLRRAQAVVAQPASTTDWVPTAPPPPLGAAPPTYAPYPPPYPPPAPRPATQMSASSTTVLPQQEAPPTKLMPSNEPYATREVSTQGAETRSFAPPPDIHTRPTMPNEQIKPSEPPASAASATPGWREPSEPSWLIDSTPAATTPAATEGAQPQPQSPAAPAQTEAATSPPSAETSDSSTQAKSDDAEESSAGKCSNCGASLPADAYFCTECGTRVKN